MARLVSKPAANRHVRPVEGRTEGLAAPHVSHVSHASGPGGKQRPIVGSRSSSRTCVYVSAVIDSFRCPSETSDLGPGAALPVQQRHAPVAQVVRRPERDRERAARLRNRGAQRVGPRCGEQPRVGVAILARRQRRVDGVGEVAGHVDPQRVTRLRRGLAQPDATARFVVVADPRLIMGATGDGGHFDALADVLADEFTVVSYDRRGNGRSPVPAGWQTTSPEEQADDAAALLGCARDRSCGGVRHEQRRQLRAVSAGPSSRMGARRDPARAGVVRPGRRFRRGASPAAGAGPGGNGERRAACRGGALLVLRGRGDDGWNRLTPALRERLRATASTLFEVELGTYELYLPDEETLAALSAPVQPARQRGRPSLLRRDHRPARQALGRGGRHHAGTHAAYHDHPCEFAEAIRPFLREVSFG